MNDNEYGPEPAPIGLQIRALRTERGWSLAELARRAGTSPPTLHRYESGWERFELATLRRLAAALEARLSVSLLPPRRPRPDPRPSKSRLVRLLRPLFWDRPLRPGDLDEYPGWVLRRVLMYGDRHQVAASRRFFGDDAVRRASVHRELDERTRNFWTLMLGAERDEPQGPQS